MKNTLLPSIYIFLKDVKQYYNKPPVLTFAFLVPGMIVALFAMEIAVLCPSKTIPGLLSLSLMFSSMTVPQSALGGDRKVGSIERLIYAPITPLSILLSKTYAGLLFGFSGFIIAVLLILPFSAVPIVSPIYTLLAAVIGSIIFSFLGIIIATLFEITQSMAIANTLRFLMIFLCGVFIPVYFLPIYLLPLSLSLPLTYITELMRYGLYGMFDYIDPVTSLTISIIYLITLGIVAIRLLEKRLMP